MALDEDDDMDENAYWRGEFLYSAVERCTGCFGCLDCSPAGDTAAQGPEPVLSRWRLLEID